MNNGEKGPPTQNRNGNQGVGLRPGSNERLRAVLVAARMKGLFNTSLAPWSEEATVAFHDRCTTTVNLADNLAIHLWPMHPHTTQNVGLTDLHADNLFHALMALSLHAVAPKNAYVHHKTTNL